MSGPRVEAAHRRAAVRRSDDDILALYTSQIRTSSAPFAKRSQIAVPGGGPKPTSIDHFDAALRLPETGHSRIRLTLFSTFASQSDRNSKILCPGSPWRAIKSEPCTQTRHASLNRCRNDLKLRRRSS